MSTMRSLSPNANFLLPTTCLENILERQGSQPDAKQLRDMVQEMVKSIFTSHEHQMMAHLRQVDNRHLDAVQDLQERISVCEAKLSNVPASGKDSDSSAADGTAVAELRDVVAESKATVAKCEAAIAEYEATAAKRDGLSQKVDGELVIMPRQTSGGAAPTPASQNQSSSKELEFSSRELQESRKHKKSASASALTSATASDASSGGAGYVKNVIIAQEQQLQNVISDVASIRKELASIQSIGTSIKSKTAAEVASDGSDHAQNTTAGSGTPASTQQDKDIDCRLDQIEFRLSVIEDSDFEMKPHAAEKDKTQRTKDSIQPLEGAASFKMGESYELRVSAWDMASLAFLPHLGYLASLWTVGLLFMNASMQLVLCVLIHDYLTTKDIDENTRQDVHRWRIIYAHSWQNKDPWTHKSLAQQICEFDESVPLSGGLAQILSQIALYLPRQEDYDHNDPLLSPILPASFHYPGPFLCCIAIIIWLLFVGEDMNETFSCCKSFWQMPCSQDGNSLIIRPSGCNMQAEEDMLIWMRISSLRRAWCFLVLAVKNMVAVCLALCGTLYLGFTLDMADLLLNACALQIVLDLDDIVAAAMAPLRVIRLVELMQPLPISSKDPMSGLNRQPVMVFLGVTFSAILAGFIVLHPQIEMLDAVRDDMCNGNTQFLAVRDTAGFIYATNVPHQVEESADRYPFMALDALAYNVNEANRDFRHGSLSAVAQGIEGGDWSLANLNSKHLDDLSYNLNAHCKNLLSPLDENEYSYAVQLYVQENAPVHIKDCTAAAVRELCNADSNLGIRIRQICPITCGCADAGSSLLIARGKNGNGCSRSCEQTSTYVSSVSDRVCADSDVLLEAFINGLESYSKSLPPTWNVTDVQGMSARLRLMGCNAATEWIAWSSRAMEWPWEDICVTSSIWPALKPLTFACPRSCQCATRKLRYCPGSC